MKPSGNGFSLIEVVLALGIVAFAMLTVIAFLPIGIKSNQISTDETRAANILTLLEADLRTPSTTGTSQFFGGIKPPYSMDAATGQSTWNGSLPSINSLSKDNSTGIQEDGTLLSYTSINPRPRYQVSVIYTYIPSTGSLAPIRARLIVNWPAMNTTDITKLTSPTAVAGFVETYVAFPAP